MKRVTIYTNHAIDNAYSCLLYLKNSLEKDYKVYLWSNSENIKTSNSILFKNKWYSKIPKVRFLIKNLDVFFSILFRDAVVIINDLDFYIPAYFAKKIRRNLKVIHYNTEIHGVDVKYFDFIESFYENHADFPDIILDCLKERAEYRKKTFNIDKEIFVINNTCTKEYIDSVIVPTFDYSKFKYIKDKLVLMYSGSCEYGIDLDKLVDSIARFGDQIYFLCYCYGKESNYNNLVKKCQETLKVDSYQINHSIERSKLINIMYYVGDIGIVYYDPSKSVNYYYAAPSKFFEYMACGLNVLSTNNQGINNIIEDHGLGKCFVNQKDISFKLEEMIENHLKDKKEIRRLFNEKYCYEKDSIVCLNEIRKVIDETIK